ncbi:hypothetical protein OVN18_00015 [Microcella daejeonensis]|uniref:Uncharacterized protein n=1 Tax=Microcella daejeonensis TaxID=2994971 RepID=A0A9E8S9X1_9MICO|nr:hypothetical protein [Microcella daejeonensis]WAB82808.1 hypothetical protein OVN18_00015 [Microcella daejeonensis]
MAARRASESLARSRVTSTSHHHSESTVAAGITTEYPMSSVGRPSNPFCTSKARRASSALTPTSSSVAAAVTRHRTPGGQVSSIADCTSGMTAMSQRPDSMPASTPTATATRSGTSHRARRTTPWSLRRSR